VLLFAVVLTDMLA